MIPLNSAILHPFRGQVPISPLLSECGRNDFFPNDSFIAGLNLFSRKFAQSNCTYWLHSCSK